MGVLRCAAALAAAAAAAACSPEIGSRTYFCGPERLCPPGQACDDTTFTCRAADRVEPFSCPEDSEQFEPDDAPGEARDAGALACGEALIEQAGGCIPDPGDADYLVFEHEAECSSGDPHIEITLRYPVALVPLEVELLGAGQQVVAEGELCTPPGDLTGREKLCLRATPPPGTYYVRVRSREDGPDCDGDCHHNQYSITIRHLLS